MLSSLRHQEPTRAAGSGRDGIGRGQDRWYGESPRRPAGVAGPPACQNASFRAARGGERSSTTTLRAGTSGGASAASARSTMDNPETGRRPSLPASKSGHPRGRPPMNFCAGLCAPGLAGAAGYRRAGSQRRPRRSPRSAAQRPRAGETWRALSNKPTLKVAGMWRGGVRRSAGAAKCRSSVIGALVGVADGEDQRAEDGGQPLRLATARGEVGLEPHVGSPRRMARAKHSRSRPRRRRLRPGSGGGRTDRARARHRAAIACAGREAMPGDPGAAAGPV